MSGSMSSSPSTDTRTQERMSDESSAPRTRARIPSRRTPSRRVRHEEKITVYVTADELFDLENVRLALRRDYDVAVDRGRIVRAALAAVLEQFDAAGTHSELVRRLKDT